MNQVDISTLTESFANKVVAFGTNSGDTLAIKDPIFELQHDKLFVVCKLPRN
jgi:hypothetical protein